MKNETRNKDITSNIKLERLCCSPDNIDGRADVQAGILWFDRGEIHGLPNCLDLSIFSVIA